MSLVTFDESRPMDFIGLGRLCIDLNANEIHRPMEETRTFTKYVGGSPANITIAIARLGKKAGFIGRVSDDQHGRFITSYLEQRGIDTSSVITDKSGTVTGLAFTEIKSPTECSILMYRDNVADLKLEPNDVREEYIKNAKAIMISGTALAASPSREAVFKAVELARKHNVVVFFDIDYRPYTWKSREETGIYCSLVAEKSDVILGQRRIRSAGGSVRSAAKGRYRDGEPLVCPSCEDRAGQARRRRFGRVHQGRAKLHGNDLPGQCRQDLRRRRFVCRSVYLWPHERMGHCTQPAVRRGLRFHRRFEPQLLGCDADGRGNSSRHR